MGLLEPHVRYRRCDGEIDLNMAAKFLFNQDKVSWRSSNKGELILALERVHSNLKCTLCGSNEFELHDPVNEDGTFSQRSTFLYLPDGPDFFPAGSRPIISFFCSECGYGMQFDEATVLRKANLIKDTSAE